MTTADLAIAWLKGHPSCTVMDVQEKFLGIDAGEFIEFEDGSRLIKDAHGIWDSYNGAM